MDLSTLLQKAFVEGFSNSELTIPAMLLSVLFAALLATYEFFIYRGLNRKTFYNRSFNLSLIALAVITAAIILTIQANIVVSLGMVGALSIVRFRTAIKDPMDLVFLFWSIAIGIICGAGFAMIAVIASAVLTIVLVLFSSRGGGQDTLILVVNANSYDCEDRVLQIVRHNTQRHKVRARNVTEAGLNLAVEVRCRKPAELIEELMESRAVKTVSLVEHDGEITA